MTEFKFDVIPGTAPFVIKEINEKHKNATVSSASRDSITIQTLDSQIETFSDIKSALRIKKDNGLIKNLYRRPWRKKTSPAGINPSLAYILCSIANLETTDVLLDPFCGGGTIPITAATEFNIQKALASDVSGKAVDMTQENFKHTNVHKNQFAVFRSNISQLKLQKNSVTKIISNLPFGIRSGDHDKNIKVYKQLFNKAKIILQNEGLMVLYTQEKKLIYENIEASNFKLVETIEVEVDKLLPSIFVIKVDDNRVGE